MESSTTVRPAALWSYPIVVGVEFDPICDFALQEAFRIAVTRPGATIHVVHVVASMAPPPRGASLLAETEPVLDATNKKFQEYISGVASRCPESRGLQLTLHDRIGSPAEAILQLSVDLNAELVIVATHGRSGVRKFALGSVATKLIEIARCPVLIVRPKDYTGLAPSPTIDPVCPACAKVRADTGDVTRWCATHAQQHPRPHVVSYDEVNPLGRTSAGINDGT